MQTRPPPLSGETLTAKSNFRVHTGIRFSIKPHPLFDVSLPPILSIVPLPTTIDVTLDSLPPPRRPMSISPYPQTKLAFQENSALTANRLSYFAASASRLSTQSSGGWNDLDPSAHVVTQVLSKVKEQ